MKDPCDLGTQNRRAVGGKEEEVQGSSAGENSNNKKRKSPAKVTPRKRSSKNNTPKKNASGNGIKGTVSSEVARKIDLRLEAKLSAEENSRMFAGRQIHPFFSSWKVEKKFREQADLELDLSSAKRDSGRNICGPIHVFEDIRDDTSSLDWGDWTLLGNTTIADCGPESSSLAVMEGSVESLNLDNIFSALQPSSPSISQNALSCSDQVSIQSDNLMQISPANPVMLENEQIAHRLKPEGAKVDLEVDSVNAVSGEACTFRTTNAEPLSRFLQESMSSYNHSCEDKAEGSLWIQKYKPTKAFEVCGNYESLTFLRNWLHLWHERRYQSRKDSSYKDQSDIPNNNDDYNRSGCEYASKDINVEGFLQNVLLVTGPVGSGKSAAVYACAHEQGFEVLEINASDCRNGTAVKQYFGDALGSHGFKRLLEHNVSSQMKTVKLPTALAVPNGKAAEEMDGGVIDLTTISNDGAHSLGETTPKLHDKNNVITSDSIRTLILVEDVDILFPEDRGCVAAIQHIAEAAKGPIILTSNSDNAGLPDNFVREHVSFSLPSSDELLCLLYKVCITEEVNVNPILLEKFIQSCDRDIRKTFMHLQFWFQNNKYRTDRKMQTIYGSLPFDLESSHQILPKIIPWNLPSDLSNLIEKEVSKSISMLEKDSCSQELVREELCVSEKKNDSDVECMGTYYLGPRIGLMKRNRSITDCSEFESQYSAISEISKSSETPVTPSWQKDQRKLLMSSYSMDKDPNNRHSVDIHDKAYKRQSLEGNSEYTCEFQVNQSFASMPFCKLLCSSSEDSKEEQCKYLETAYERCLNKTQKSFDESYLESRYISETAIQNRIETISGVVCSGQLAGPVDVLLDNELTPFSFGVCRRLSKLPRNSTSLMNTEIPKSSPKATAQHFSDENTETTTVQKMIDECSHADFELKSKFIDSSPPKEIDMVQDLWRKLRECRMDLRQHVSSEPMGAIQVVKLASGLSNLISDVDLLFRNHQQKQCGIMEPPIFLSDEATFDWYDEQMMMSTVALHGFCFYAKHIADVGSKLGYENRIDITSEMLASSSNIMALGKLSRQDHTKSISNYTKKLIEANNSRNDKSMQYNETRTPLFDVIRSIFPARFLLAMKGSAFSEYLSSLRQISISEGFRISQGVKKMRKGRRGAQHYLSRGTLMLSPKDLSLMCEGDLYKKMSSQYSANMESNCA